MFALDLVGDRAAARVGAGAIAEPLDDQLAGQLIEPRLADAGTVDRVRLEAAYDRFAQAVGEAGEIVKRHPFYRDPVNRASGFAFVSSMLIATLL